MKETLLNPSGILLYGRELKDLQLKFEKPSNKPPEEGPEVAKEGQTGDASPVPRLGDNNFLQNQLSASGARLARIYGFSFEGHYYDLAVPAIFLVHGPGSDPEALRPGPALPHGRWSRAPADADRTGVANQDYSFSHDMRVWAYDKNDYSIRLDVETGTFEEILLEAALGADGSQASYSGAKVRGAKVRGAKVSGAKVRGAKVGLGRNDDLGD